MPQLKKAPGVDHEHVAYIRDNLTGYTSYDANHTHMIVDGVLGENQGHIHQLSDIAVNAKSEKPRGKEEEIVEEVIEIYKAQKEYERKSREQGYEAERFYRGKQWDDSDKEKLKAEGRASLTINEIQSKIDLLSGFQRIFRTDVQFLPVEGGDQAIADILNVVSKNIDDQNCIEQEESQMFLDMLKPGRGALTAYVDFDKNPLGDIVVERLPWDELYMGPHDKLDASDCEIVTKAKWFTKDKAKTLWPEKADEIEAAFSMPDSEENPEMDTVIHGKQYITGASKMNDADIVDKIRRSVRVFEQWRKEFYRSDFIVNAEDNFVQSAEGIDRKYVDMIETIPGFMKINRNDYRIRVTAVAGRSLVRDIYLPHQIRDILISVAYAHKQKEEFWGVVDVMKDTQREVNKRHSQMADILNKMSSYGWFYDDRTFMSDQDLADFENKSASAGFMQRLTDSSKPPFKVEGAKFPVEIANMAIAESDKMRQLSSIPEMPRQDVNSGKQIIEARRTGLIGNEYLFDSFNIAKRRMAKMKLSLIQIIYTPERILRVIENKAISGGVKIGDQRLEGELSEQVRNVIAEALENADLSKYDVATTTVPTSPTVRRGVFETWSDLAKQGLPVPMDLLIEYSDLPEKDRITDMYRQQQAAAAAIEKGKQDTEIKKTMISASAKGADFGQVPASQPTAESISMEGV